jgi:hypothetical protein
MSGPVAPYAAAPRPTKYCQACGRVVDAAAVVCPTCGVMQADMAGAVGLLGGYPGHSEKRILVAVLLCMFVGPFGLHRFYAGKIGTGVLQLLTLGGLGIWWLYDLILLVTGNFRDGEGERITQWT